MELDDFLNKLYEDIAAEINDRLATPEESFPYPENIFAEQVMNHMAGIGMTFDPVACYFDEKIGNAKVKINGYAVSDDADQLDLFVCIYGDNKEITSITDTDTKSAAEQCIRFLTLCAEGKLAKHIGPSKDAYEPALAIESCYANLTQIRIYVLTDRVAKSKNFKSREIKGKTIRLEVMDVERLYRHMDGGEERAELIVNFSEVCGTPLPCVPISGDTNDYDYILTAIPGEALRFLYEKYGARLLEANVRSFLNSTGNVNKGIRETLRLEPEKFMSYNNGIVVVADEAHLGKTLDGGPGLTWLKGMQIVNGGQTTASIYFQKKKFPEIDLSKVRVAAKIVVMKNHASSEEALISDISKYANTQNTVKQSDLSANKPFHVELEKIAQITYCPDGVGKWFYERASGSYTTTLAREGDTPAKLRRLREDVIPTSRKITKTDLAKYLNTWDKKPYVASLGAQKNFIEFMKNLDKDVDEEKGIKSPIPTSADFKVMVGKAILFKKTTAIVRSQNFPAFQGNITIYLISLLSELSAGKFDFNKVWLNQDISQQLKDQLILWSSEINDGLNKTANGRMISEWAKRIECWDLIKGRQYSPIKQNISELI
jgi:hypothetical protein